MTKYFIDVFLARFFHIFILWKVISFIDPTEFARIQMLILVIESYRVLLDSVITSSQLRSKAVTIPLHIILLTVLVTLFSAYFFILDWGVFNFWSLLYVLLILILSPTFFVVRCFVLKSLGAKQIFYYNIAASFLSFVITLFLIFLRADAFVLIMSYGLFHNLSFVLIFTLNRRDNNGFKLSFEKRNESLFLFGQGVLSRIYVQSHDFIILKSLSSQVTGIFFQANRISAIPANGVASAVSQALIGNSALRPRRAYALGFILSLAMFLGVLWLSKSDSAVKHVPLVWHDMLNILPALFLGRIFTVQAQLFSAELVSRHLDRYLFSVNLISSIAGILIIYFGIGVFTLVDTVIFTFVISFILLFITNIILVGFDYVKTIFACLSICLWVYQL